MNSAVKDSLRKEAQKIKKTVGFSFRNPKWVESALTHPSYRNENRCPPLLDFDRLEFFGDSILNYVICRHLYRLFPAANEGMLSRLRSILVSRKILFRVAQELHLQSIVKLGKSIRPQLRFAKSKILADTLESLLAAIYLDNGLPKTEKFILQHFKSYFDAKRLFRLDPNPKSTLQELSQKQWQKLPIYASELTPSGIKTTVAIGKMRTATGFARTRQESEEKAARLLLRKLRQELVRRSNKASSGKKLRKTF